MNENNEEIKQVEKRARCFQCDILDGATVIYLDILE